MEDYSNNKKDSPVKFWQSLVTNPALMGAAVSGVGGLLGGLMGRGKRRRQQREAKAEYDKMRKSYEGLDTSNIYADVKNQYTGMENVYEDLTVNQQQAQFQAQQGAQQRANIMQGLRGSAGSSGIAGLAQSLANQGQRQAQQASASIGQQEAQNQRIRQGEAGRLQTMERQGESQAEATRLGGQAQSRSLDWQKQSTLFGMSQQRLAGANKAISSANQAMWSGIGKIGGAIGGAALAGGGIGGGTQTPNINTTDSLGSGDINYPPQSAINVPGAAANDYTIPTVSQKIIGFDSNNQPIYG